MPPRLHLFDQNYSKNIEIVEYYYNYYNNCPLFEMDTFCNIINVFTVTFYPFNTTLLNKIINSS